MHCCQINKSILKRIRNDLAFSQLNGKRIAYYSDDYPSGLKNKVVSEFGKW